MHTSSSHRPHGPSRRPRGAGKDASGGPGGSRLRNAPAERRRAEQPGAGTPAADGVTVTIRDRRQSVMPSGRVRRRWVLTFEPTSGAALDPLTGWTTQSDPLAGHEVAFHTAQAAIAFADRRGWRHHLVGEGRAEEGASVGYGSADEALCPIDEQLKQSFPASDSPSWTLGRSRPS